MQTRMWTLYLAPLVSVASAVNINALNSLNCVENEGRSVVTRCSNIPEGVCCNFPLDLAVSSVYIGTFPLPGGVGSWHYNSAAIRGVQCGREMVSDGNSYSVCLSAGVTGLYDTLTLGGGGMWVPVPRIDPAKSRDGSVIPRINPPTGFKVIAPFGWSGSKRRSASSQDGEIERRNNEISMSMDEWQVNGSRSVYTGRTMSLT